MSATVDSEQLSRRAARRYFLAVLNLGFRAQGRFSVRRANLVNKDFFGDAAALGASSPLRGSLTSP
jgi:hypothetical protein